MPSTPYAKLLVSINGGATTSGGITAANSDTVQLTAESTAQWDLTTPPRWVIYAYPPNWTGPASGWTTESVPSPFGGTSDIYVYTGLGPPPIFTLPALPMWGKFLFDLTVAGGILNGSDAPQLIDRTTGVQILGPGGLTDIAVTEEIQFDASRAWVGTWQDDLRILDAAIVAAATPFAGIPSPIVFGAANPGTPGTYATGTHDHELTFTTLNLVLAAASAAIDVNGQTITSGGFVGPYFSTSAANPATTGLVRGAHGTVLAAARDFVNGNNVPLLSFGVGTNDLLTIGDSLIPCMKFVIASGCDFQFYHDADLLYTLEQNAVTVGATNGFLLTHTTGVGAGATATIKAQAGAATFAGGKLSLEAGDPGAGGAPTGIDLELEASATVSGTLSVKGGAFGTLASVAYVDAGPETTITLGPGATAARIDANVLRVDATNLKLFTDGDDFAGGTGILQISNATTAPTSISQSVKMYAIGKALEVEGLLSTTLMPEAESAAGTEDLRAPDRRAKRITTTDATVTTAYTFALPTSCSAHFEVIVVAYTPADGVSATYKVEGGAKRFGAAAAALVGAPITTPWEDDAAYNATMEVSGNNAVIKVTGVAATTVEWFVTPNVTLMQPA